MKGLQISYSLNELEFIKANRKMLRRDMHKAFCIKFKRDDINLVNLNALCKRKGWLTGRTGCFKKGNIPHPDAHPKGPNKTSFKKGNSPHNWKPVGSTRTTKDGYIEIKIEEPNKWAQKHILIWEDKRGKVRNGFCVSFKDGDKENCVMSNLELISRNANLQINRLKQPDEPLELRPVIRSLGKLVAKTLDCQIKK